MSGAAGLSAAKRRRGVQASNFAAELPESTHSVPESSALPVHPMQQLQIHEHKLNGLLAHIQALGEAFVEHRTEVAQAIPQLQEAVEELLRAAQLPSILENTVVEEEPEEEVNDGEGELYNQRFMMSMTKELSDRLTEKLEQVAREHADTKARLSGTEAEVKQLKAQLTESRKKSRSDQSVQKEPTFPNKSDADIVKEALARVSDSNVTLQTIEEEEDA